MSIEVKDLVKVYGEQKAVDSISFTVGKGEIVGFLGPNGAGKSTTMKILTGYLGQDGGEAAICGISVREHPLETKKKIGYLPEANPLYPDMYVREYLGFIADIHHLTGKRQRIETVITLVGLSVESKKKLGQLSKGYKQRVGLAAALLHEPEVLILDEPTSGLDPNQIIEIRDVIRKWKPFATGSSSSIREDWWRIAHSASYGLKMPGRIPYRSHSARTPKHQPWNNWITSLLFPGCRMDSGSCRQQRRMKLRNN